MHTWSNREGQLWFRDIDGVQRAIESGKPYEIADKLSDAYFELWDIATAPVAEMPGLDKKAKETARRGKIVRRLAFLTQYHKGILQSFQRDSASDSTPVSPTLSELYESALAEIKAMYSIEDSEIET